MYKIIIADDEAAIREGIASSIPWESWGFQVVGLYENGLQALEHVKRDAPHLVLSDIRMPKMDGVELMQALNKDFPDVKIIILSGYSDFEYLNMSIKNNVYEYLLKPTDIDEFESLFKKVRARLNEEHNQKQQAEKSRKTLYINWLNLLLKGFLDDAEALKELEEDEKFYFENCAVMLFTPDGRLGDADKDLYNLKAQIAEICNETLDKKSGGSFNGRFFLNHEEIITGVIGTKAEDDLDKETLSTLACTVQADVFEKLKTTVSAGVSTLCTEPDMLPACYQQAKCCVRQNVFLGAENLFFYSQFEDETMPNEELLDVNRIKQAMLSGELDELNEELKQNFSAFENRAHKQYDYIDQMCIDALFSISRWALQYNVRFDHILDGLGTSYTDIYRCDTLDKKRCFIMALFYATQGKLAEEKPAGRGRSSLAYMAKSCVDEEFMKNSISLEYVANRLHKTPAHISKVFKNELGLNFSEYLTHKRLEKSTELLADMSLKVYEIAGMVGYADTSNFIKVFRKNYGVSPNEHRQSLAEGVPL